MVKDGVVVEITYRSKDIQPPLWLAGSFSKPPWTPVEMEHKTAADGEHIFTKSIRAKPGTEVQYKFRVGEGDWWVLDESIPTVTDDMGNRNNVLKVKAHESAKSNPSVQKPPTPPPDSPILPTAAAGLSNLHIPVPGGISRSDASTPSFVKTTMEVADTAAQIDARTPESEAAEHEVPDSSVDYLDVDIGPEFPHERPGEEDDGLDAAPVFAYEYAGSYELPAAVAAESEYSPTSPAFSAHDKNFDPEDPTLERFPSNREDILSRVRTLETGLDEDPTMFEGYPASPVVTPGRKTSVGSIDMAGDSFSISPTTNPNRPVGNRRPESHKRNSSRDSLVLDPSPAASPSLQCIVEETGTDDQEHSLLPDPVQSDLLSPTAAAKSDVPNPEAVLLTSEAISPKTKVARLANPAIVVHKAQESDVGSPMNVRGAPISTDNCPGDFPDIDESEGPSSPAAGAQSSTRDVAATNEAQSGTPVSHHPKGVEVKGNSNWFASFIKLVFVDWLGGFLASIFRSRRAE
ncbi:hypothetical protein SPBR_00453 [Sporothrix brasiliensis 5110]|uniref:AMP-activated protein kinase glycogen-binding domain-containing protein n=1 Tax=Sporothrix brasiliensis 5110 TaxID=1398154 RepID=A0A0C2FHS4_9PEZI|nr:uncharacterized protein SPBR_00453 [Sporothrix brasiliensis 5110]KIH90618.1 hypothetical protein SPBR_00453 [Sporothrix brasiliensis 5110]